MKTIALNKNVKGNRKNWSFINVLARTHVTFMGVRLQKDNESS